MSLSEDANTLRPFRISRTKITFCEEALENTADLRRKLCEEECWVGSKDDQSALSKIGQYWHCSRTEPEKAYQSYPTVEYDGRPGKSFWTKIRGRRPGNVRPITLRPTPHKPTLRSLKTVMVGGFMLVSESWQLERQPFRHRFKWSLAGR